MKVKVKDLKPNPYRNMDKYPVDREKVDALIISIHETSFWDNLLAREKDGVLQIAYGHHRLIALQELEVKTIDIPVKPIDDSMMLRIMANENMDSWGMSPTTTMETIRAVRDFIISGLNRYPTWEEFAQSELNEVIRFTNSQTFSSAKGNKGVGTPTILKFLGKGWTHDMVQHAMQALKAIEEETIDEKAVESLPTMRHVREFTKSAKGLPKEKQRKLAKEIKEEETPSRSIPTKVIETKYKPEKKEKKENKERKKAQETFDLFLLHTNQSLLDVISRMKDIKRIKEQFGDAIIADKSLSTSVTTNMEVLNNQLTELLKTEENEKN